MSTDRFHALSPARTWSIIRMNASLFAGEPGPLIGRILMPLVLLTITRPLYTAALGRTGGTASAVAGMLVTFSLLGMSIVGSSILQERLWHTAPRLRASAAGPADILVGKAVPVFVLLIVQQAVILGYGRLVFGLSVGSPGLLAGTVVVWSATLTALGGLLGTLARSGGALSAMVDIGSMTVTGLGGAFVPLALLPGWAHTLAPASPGYWAVHALRGSLDGAAAATASGCLVLALIAGLAGTAAGHRLRRSSVRTGAA